MYSIDLAKISLDEFGEIITSADLLPGRRMLTQGLQENIVRLKAKGISHLAGLQQLLKNKKRLPELAIELAISTEYLVVLNREVNSYVSKPLPLTNLGVLSVVELRNLSKLGVTTTQHLYERCITKNSRQALAKQAHMAMGQLTGVLALADLLRINGVGATYAQLLLQIGISCPADYLKMDPNQLLVLIQQTNKQNAVTKAKLGLRDIDYCRRFCVKLDSDIER